MSTIYNKIIENQKVNKKSLAVLIDPDNLDFSLLEQKIDLAVKADVDYFFLGGSLIADDCLDKALDIIKAKCSIPTVIFPGTVQQINGKADAILLLSLISGRNPETLIGNHVAAAPILKASGLEIISTGYMLIDSGRATTASYISNTLPIPHDKAQIAACTAMAGEMLGLKLMFLDGGSGGVNAVSDKMIAATRKAVDCPIIVGGGIKTAQKAKSLYDAGADIVVVGNAFEKNAALILEIAAAKK
jgi:phosphoglycerol geranylgeranyltransferase